MIQTTKNLQLIFLLHQGQSNVNNKIKREEIDYIRVAVHKIITSQINNKKKIQKLFQSWSINLRAQTINKDSIYNLINITKKYSKMKLILWKRIKSKWKIRLTSYIKGKIKINNKYINFHTFKLQMNK